MGLFLILDLRDLNDEISDPLEFGVDVLGASEVLLLCKNAFFVVCVDPRNLISVNKAHNGVSKRFQVVPPAERIPNVSRHRGVVWGTFEAVFSEAPVYTVLHILHDEAHIKNKYSVVT